MYRYLAGAILIFSGSSLSAEKCSTLFLIRVDLKYYVKSLVKFALISFYWPHDRFNFIIFRLGNTDWRLASCYEEISFMA